MDFDYEFTKMMAEESMGNAITQYRSNLSRISAGRANPQILQSINVDYFGTSTPLSQLANISVPEPRQLLIKPYDISVNKEIVGAINSASLGINAVDEGDKTRISFPELTTDRRRELVKSLNKYTEQAKVQIRAARQEANKQIKGAEGLAEDYEKQILNEIQKLTDKFVEEVSVVTKEKEKELMTI